MPTKKNYMKFFSIFLLLLMSLGSYAHQPDLSTVVVSKTDDGKYVMQITGSLTAFEGEVDYIFGKNAYKTADEFRELVIKHFRKNTSFIVNGQALVFVKPEVILGHETKLVVEVLGLPEQINSIDLKSSMFSDMYNNQSVVMMIGKEFPNDKYILNNDNSQQIKLETKDGKWNNIIQAGSIPDAKNTFYLLLLLVIPLVYFLVKLIKRKNITLTENSNTILFRSFLHRFVTFSCVFRTVGIYSYYRIAFRCVFVVQSN